MAQLRQYQNAFKVANVQVVLVAMATPDKVRAFKQAFELPYTMISDPSRELHQMLAIGFMSMASTFSPTMVVKVATALAKGHGIGMPYGDIRQLPAVFIIETDGTIAHSHYGNDAADHPTPEKIFELINHATI